MNQNKAMALAGSLWCTIGVILLIRGLSFVQLMLETPVKGPLLNFFSQFSLPQSLSAPIVLLLLGVLIGFIKGNTVLKKNAEKNIVRLSSMGKIPVWKIFPPSGWGIMVVMSMMGMVIRSVGIAIDIRSVILVAVGSALIQGGMSYFTGVVKQLLIKP